MMLSCFVVPISAAAPGDALMPFTSNAINQHILAGAAVAVKQRIWLDKGEEVKFDCDYLPKSASVDFGVIDVDGRFYAINCTGGSINKSIEITARSQYSLAIRNNAAYETTVVGEVHY